MSDHPLVAAVRRHLGGDAGRLVAVSGGPDSVALLRAAYDVNPVGLSACHVNHQLRGADSDGDEQFVRDLCQSWNIPLTVSAGPVEPGRGVEAAARRVRYAHLNVAAKANGATAVATGHTRDDQAETVLHRVIRGTGIAGLAGIPRRRRLSDGVELVRPMLHVGRDQVLDYLHSLNQKYRTDVSNADTTLTRNRIRHDVMPVLRSMNPRVGEALARLAEQAADLDDDGVTFPGLMRVGSTCVIPADAVADWSRARLRTAWRQLWRREGWPCGRMTFADFDRLAGLAVGETPAVDLPGRVRAVRQGRVIRVGV